MEYTTIRISKEVKERLDKCMSKNESYDDKLLEMIEVNKR